LYGASPRASIALLFASKTLAWLQWRDHVIYEDVQSLALMILRHRVIFQYHISIDINQSTDHILAELLSNVKLGS
jgi:MoxR-like ATPase